MQAHGLLRVRRRRHMSHRARSCSATGGAREVRATRWSTSEDCAPRLPLRLAESGGPPRPLAARHRARILDDHSRLCCHLQCYLSETAEVLVHGLSQAIQKRGLPRAVMSDNGSAMLAEEFTEGLQRLGIVHQRTLTYAPHQNGKQECFWSQLEGRLMQMLSGVADLTLDFLNQALQAWVELEYTRAVHRETGCSPVERFGQSPDVLRRSPRARTCATRFDGTSPGISDVVTGPSVWKGQRFGSSPLSSLSESDCPLRPLGSGASRHRLTP
jgi:transposase InsO family protein